jgi:hypothetical protein
MHYLFTTVGVKEMLLSPLLFNFVLEYTTRKAKEKMHSLELNWTSFWHMLMMLIQ